MSKIYIILALLVGIIIGVVSLHYYDKDYYNNYYDNLYHGRTFPLSKQNIELNYLDYKFLNEWWDSRNCNISKASSLINLVHIKKVNGNYSISCEFGSLYQGLNYSNTEGKSVFYGLIMSCDEESAKEIDDAVRSKLSCVFPLSNPIPNDLTDYYVFYVGCKQFNPKTYVTCLPELLNQDARFYFGAIAVIDFNSRYIYY